MKLSDLLVPGATLTQGDKEFSDFAYSATGDMPLPENVNVVTHTDPSGNFGLRFQGGFLDAPDPANQSSDALITYKVRVTDDTHWISAANLAANLYAADGGTATITETFLPVFSTTDQVLRIPTSGQGLIDHVDFPTPQRELLAQKNILMRATTSQVDMSFVDQTYEQVPEPSSGGLLLLSLGSLASFGGRRRYS